MIESQTENLDTYIEEIEVVNPNWITEQRAQPEAKYTGAIPKGINTSHPNSALMQAPVVEHLPKKFKTVVDMINKGFRVCVILRGLPGSGKSFLAHQIIEKTVKDPDNHILSADKFFMRGGRYQYDASRIQEAHEATQRLFAQRASQGMSPLIVDNTNVEYWQMLYYLQVAIQYGYHIEIMEPETPWKNSDFSLVSKNIHSVPLVTIRRMKQNFEKGVGLQQLLDNYGLQMPTTPKKRNIPTLMNEAPDKSKVIINPFGASRSSKVTMKEPSPPILENSDLIDFRETAPTSPAPTIPNFPSFQWGLPSEAYQEAADLPKESATIVTTSNVADTNEKTEIQDIFSRVFNVEFPLKETPAEAPQTGRNKKKGKKESKLVPHRKNCPKENPNFAHIREFYPHLNETYLWDFFERCNGDAEWCANLLFEDNLEAAEGDPLTCSCDSEESKELIPKQQQKKSIANVKPASPAIKPKKKEVFSVDEFLRMKEEIEKSVKIAPEHYPDHVNTVKNWKRGPTSPLPIAIEPEVIDKQPEKPLSSASPEFEEELQEVTIGSDLILELDAEFGGLLKNFPKGNFPPKIFIKRSTAHLLYLEIMEAHYSHEEESRIWMMRADEEMAKKLNEEEELPTLTTDFKAVDVNVWKDENDDEGFSVKMSKEKLIKLFPMLNENDLLEIFKSAGYNFKETVEQIEDSLNLKPSERREVAEAQKRIFNESWQTNKTKVQAKRSAPTKTDDKDNCTEEHLRTVEDLRQDIQDHVEEQRVCFSKAREAIEKKNFELASYYSNIAQLHKEKADESKHEVANLIANIHEKSQASSTTLDLHYYSTIEAEAVLEAFLDKNISRLRDIRRPHIDLFIITGRGKNSINGVPAVKNNTKVVLNRRCLKAFEQNPGFLKVRIFMNSVLSNEGQ